MEIKTKLVPIDWLGDEIPHGHSCGYIGVPKGHPWFNMNYNTIEQEYPDLSIHGGLTYSKNYAPKECVPDGLWWIGFDTAHYGDNKHNCNEQYCINEVESLKQQALAVCSNSPTN